uniref:Uncharacterized protein n=1 Tax=Homalodisca liturata TaxID=320908 RepID=A0A1B6IS04_9HEMI
METSELRNLYECERNRLNTLCDKWQKVLDKTPTKSINDENRGKIMAVLGQTRLLLSKKMKQFEGLLSDSNNDSEFTHPPITLQDLEGFWELVMIQVNEMYIKFKSLEEGNVPGEGNRVHTPKNRASPMPRYR